jgi:hypothetical protein
MSTGRGLEIDLGMSVTPHLTVGGHAGLGVYEPKIEQLGPLDATVSDNWIRYVGGLFGEYRLTQSLISPFVGASLGLQAVYINYAESTDGFAGQGDYGWGFGLATGLQYRSSHRLGAVLRFSFENSPDMGGGWFVQAELGLRLFL